MAVPKSLGHIVNGQFDLTGRKLTSSDLGKIPVLPALRELILSDNSIGTFRHLRPQPNLETIIATNNPVKFLDGLSAQRTLVNLDLSDTPLAGEQFFRPTVVATVGVRLETLNGEAVTKGERDGAAQLATDPGVLYLEQNDTEPPHHDPAMLAVYLREHRRLFSTFAYNRAVLLDLKTSGPVPVVDATTTEAGLVKATEAMKARNRKLREVIQNTEGELGTGQSDV
jgi:hypothetical protein